MFPLLCRWQRCRAVRQRAGSVRLNCYHWTVPWASPWGR